MADDPGESPGKAYAFFHCDAAPQAIEAEIPTIRDLVRSPSELELLLHSSLESVRGDERLMEFVGMARNAGLEYCLEGAYLRHTNREAADELATVMNQMYNTPLYKEGERFAGEIVFEHEGMYVMRE